jgi:hypothetical protein
MAGARPVAACDGHPRSGWLFVDDLINGRLDIISQISV